MINKQHPRILLLQGEENQIKQTITNNPTWLKLHEAILNECDKILTLPQLERQMNGMTLLDKSREALRRIFYLSYAWRMTGHDKYFHRCEKELLAVSNFKDWNPSHFLDVAEMTMAVAIGYDWLFPQLSVDSKKIISDAIVSKGLNPEIKSDDFCWQKAKSNWNQVCNTGITYGALAVAEEHPELAKKIIDRAIQTITIPMDEYKPDGAYPEGYTYWGYGTSFNVMFICALEKVFNTDFGLSNTPGFLQTADFCQHMVGNIGLNFNWADGATKTTLNPTIFWFAKRNNDLSPLWVEKAYLERDNYSEFTSDRLLPALMIWCRDLPINQITEPDVKFWCGRGANPVCMMRTSWSNRDAIYLGFKAGSAAVSHAHMDAGSFVMESDGVRWASDPDTQDYYSLISKGVDLWNFVQDSQRWSVFRLNNFSHNTLTIDSKLQVVKGVAHIDKSSANPDFMYAVSDLSAVYENQLANVKRGVAIINQKVVVIQDELFANSNPATVRWSMFTTATPKLAKNSITLAKDGKTLELKVISPAEFTIKTWSTQPTNDYDAPNPGTILVGFEFNLEPNQQQTIQVMLIPGSSSDNEIQLKKTLASW
ncbi:MAG: heparinase II/III family protein [Lentisphaerota bacterium]